MNPSHSYTIQLCGSLKTSICNLLGTAVCMQWYSATAGTTNGLLNRKALGIWPSPAPTFWSLPDAQLGAQVTFGAGVSCGSYPTPVSSVILSLICDTNVTGVPQVNVTYPANTATSCTFFATVVHSAACPIYYFSSSSSTSATLPTSSTTTVNDSTPIYGTSSTASTIPKPKQSDETYIIVGGVAVVVLGAVTAAACIVRRRRRLNVVPDDVESDERSSLMINDHSRLLNSVVGSNFEEPSRSERASEGSSGVVAVSYDDSARMITLKTADERRANQSGKSPAVISIAVEGVTVFQPAQLVVERALGEGGFGVVHLVRDTRLRTRMAMKVFKGNSPSLIESFVREATVMFNLHHPCCLRVMGISVEPGRFCLLTEYMDHGDLSHALPRLQSQGIHVMIPILSDVCTGLAYLHTKGMAHADIKPANVLMNGRGGVVLADFGLVNFSGRACTPFYAAPEVLAGSVCDTRADMFSFGVMAWEMLAAPEDVNARRQSVRSLDLGTASSAASSIGSANNQRFFVACSSLPASVPLVLRQLVTACLDVRPSARPTSEHAIGEVAACVSDATLNMDE